MKEMEAEVNRVLKGGNCHEVLSEGFGLSLTRKDLQTLSNLNWLNDEVSICCFITTRRMSSLWSWAVPVVCPVHWNSSYCSGDQLLHESADGAQPEAQSSLS